MHSGSETTLLDGHFDISTRFQLGSPYVSQQQKQKLKILSKNRP